MHNMCMNVCHVKCHVWGICWTGWHVRGAEVFIHAAGRVREHAVVCVTLLCAVAFPLHHHVYSRASVKHKQQCNAYSRALTRSISLSLQQWDHNIAQGLILGNCFWVTQSRFCMKQPAYLPTSYCSTHRWTDPSRSSCCHLKHAPGHLHLLLLTRMVQTNSV